MVIDLRHVGWACQAGAHEDCLRVACECRCHKEYQAAVAAFALGSTVLIVAAAMLMQWLGWWS